MKWNWLVYLSGFSTGTAVVVMVMVVVWLLGLFTPKIQPGTTESVAAQLDPRREAVEPVVPVFKPYVEEAVGTVRSALRTEISARVMASITAIHVRAGDMVATGQVLVELDRKDLDARVSRAKAAITEAEAAVAEASDNYGRTLRLWNQKTGVVTEQELNRAKAALDMAQARQAQATEALAAAEVGLSYATIKAPRAGKIVDRLAEVGDMAVPGQPLLTLYDPQTLRLEVSVMENLEGRLQVGGKVPVTIDALNRTIEGVIDEKVPQADAASRSFLVKIKLPPIDGLFEGMFGRVEIAVGNRRHLCLNTSAIHRVGQLEFVEVVGPEGAKEWRMIKTGRLGRPGHVEVLSGLEADEKVAVPRQAQAAAAPR